MRRFEDAHGSAWDVVVGRESWGAFYAIFVPAGAGRREPVRQAPLHGSSAEAAEAELAAMDDATLRALLARSVVKER
ncbi:MAG TPA: hypothetical protein VF188_10415 [Longimicrobiales bacterium]